MEVIEPKVPKGIKYLVISSFRAFSGPLKKAKYVLKALTTQKTKNKTITNYI